MLARILFLLLLASVAQAETRHETLHGIRQGNTHACDHALQSKYRTTPMLLSYVGEAEGKIPQYKTRYLNTEEERAPYRITVKNGLLYDANGFLLDTSEGWVHDSERGLLKGTSIFVMDGAGKFYSVKQDDPTFYHSTFLAGAPVASGGQWRVHQGVIEKMDDRSGHYFKGKEHVAQTYFDQALTELRSQSINTVNIRLEYTLPVFHDDYFSDF
jgi:hypothetical protein